MSAVEVFVYGGGDAALLHAQKQLQTA